MPTAPPTPVTWVGTVFAPLRAVGYHRVAAQDVTVEWPRSRVAALSSDPQWQLAHSGRRRGASSPTSSARVIYPEDARDSGHDGCCYWLHDGVGVGACCCDHFLRSRACGAGECWVEVDFGAAVGVGCMQYSVSGSNDASTHSSSSCHGRWHLTLAYPWTGLTHPRRRSNTGCLDSRRLQSSLHLARPQIR